MKKVVCKCVFGVILLIIFFFSLLGIKDLIRVDYESVFLVILSVVFYIFILYSFSTEKNDVMINFRNFIMMGVFFAVSDILRLNTSSLQIALFGTRLLFVIIIFFTQYYLLTALSIFDFSLSRWIRRLRGLLNIILVYFIMFTDVMIRRNFYENGLIRYEFGILKLPLMILMLSLVLCALYIMLKRIKYNNYVILIDVFLILVVFFFLLYLTLGLHQFTIMHSITSLVLTIILCVPMYTHGLIKIRSIPIFSIIGVFLIIMILLFVINAYEMTSNIKETSVNNAIDDMKLSLIHGADEIESILTDYENEMHILFYRDFGTENEEYMIGEFVSEHDDVLSVAVYDSFGRAKYSKGNVGYIKTIEYFVSENPIIEYTQDIEKNVIANLFLPFYLQGEYLGGAFLFLNFSNIVDTQMKPFYVDESLFIFSNQDGTIFFSDKFDFIGENFDNIFSKVEMYKEIQDNSLMVRFYNYPGFPPIQKKDLVVSHEFTLYSNVSWIHAIYPVKNAYKDTTMSLNKIWIYTGVTIVLLILFSFILNRYFTKELRVEVADKTKKLNVLNRQLERKVKKRTIKLMEAYQNLKKLDDMKDDFLSNVSHELRTPLTSIKLHTELLLDQVLGKLNKKQMESMKMVLDASDGLFHLVNNILTISRYEADRAEFEFKDIEVKEALDKVIKEFGISIKKVKGSIKQELFYEGVVYSDRLKLIQIFRNLISNSIKYRSNKKLLIQIIIKKHKNYVRFEFKDNGIGMSSQEKKHVFDKFYQARRGTRKSEGSGLGLAIVHRIIIKLHGRIEVKSKKGHGSSVIFYVPISEKEFRRFVG